MCVTVPNQYGHQQSQWKTFNFKSFRSFPLEINYKTIRLNLIHLFQLFISKNAFYYFSYSEPAGTAQRFNNGACFYGTCTSVSTILTGSTETVIMFEPCFIFDKGFGSASNVLTALPRLCQYFRKLDRFGADTCVIVSIHLTNLPWSEFAFEQCVEMQYHCHMIRPLPSFHNIFS
jgi:hypothetical protein